MRIAIYGNFTLDEISSRGVRYKSFGGPPVYAGLFLATSPVKLVVVGCAGRLAAPASRLLKETGAEVLEPCDCDKTSAFDLSREKSNAAVRETGCTMHLDAAILADFHYVNPVIGELDAGELKMMVGGKIYLDPQGFIRKRKAGALKHVAAPNVLDKAADFLKVSPDEIKYVRSIRPRCGLLTFKGGFALLFHGDSEYRLPVRKKTAFDGIGAGDLFGAGFVLGMMLGGPETALAYGQAASSAKIGLRGVLKVPTFEEVREVAEQMIKDVVKSEAAPRKNSFKNKTNVHG